LKSKYFVKQLKTNKQMLMNTLPQELKKYFSRITNFLLTACMILAISIGGVQAQDDPPVPDPMPALFYFQVGDEKTNEITLAPGDNFTLRVGFTLIGPSDGGTITLLWNPDELVIPGTQVTNLIASLLPIPMWNAISQDIGHLSFTQGILGGYLLPPANDEGGYGPLDYPMIEFQVNVPEDATWSSAEITHQLDQSVVDSSLLAFDGTSLVDYENSPMVFTVFNSEAVVVDCEELGLNIGDACDDGDDTTENDTVTADCECVGTTVYECPELEANIGDACDDGNPDTENDTVTADCECIGTPILVFDCPDLNANIGDTC